MFENIAGRKWQQEALDGFFSEEEKSKTYFVEACPGGGKTRMSIAAIAAAFANNEITMAVVVAPQSAVAAQWAADAKEMLPQYNVELVVGANDEALTAKQLAARLRNSGNKIDILVITYAGLSGPIIPDMIDNIARNGKLMAVCDEIHHAGETKSWGRSVIRAFAHASRRLWLSGTPFRGSPIRDKDTGEIIRFTDSDKIPFAVYVPVEDSDDDTMALKSDYAYSYAQAVDDGVCRNIVFNRIGGRIEWDEVIDGVVIPNDYMMQDEVEEKIRVTRMQVALSEASNMTNDLIDSSMKKLSEIRDVQNDAALLVVADSKKHAFLIRNYLAKSYNIDAPVVYSDNDESQDIIKKFKKDTTPVIISIQMFAEGVDAPRIRVISYLSRRVAPLFFLQVIGRAVRMQTGPGYQSPSDQWAYMYMPADQVLCKMAADVEKQLGHVVGPIEIPDPKCPECGYTPHKAKRGSPCPECGYEPFPIDPPPTRNLNTKSGEGVSDGFISMGITTSQEAVNQSIELRANDRRLERFTVEQLTLVREILLKNPKYLHRFETDLI